MAPIITKSTTRPTTPATIIEVWKSGGIPPESEEEFPVVEITVVLMEDEIPDEDVTPVDPDVESMVVIEDVLRDDVEDVSGGIGTRPVIPPVPFGRFVGHEDPGSGEEQDCDADNCKTASPLVALKHKLYFWNSRKSEFENTEVDAVPFHMEFPSEDVIGDHRKRVTEEMSKALDSTYLTRKDPSSDIEVKFICDTCITSQTENSKTAS